MVKALRMQMVVAAFLAAVFLFSSFSVNISVVRAQSEVATTISVRAEAPEGQYDYTPVRILTKISPLPPIDYLDHFENVQLTIIDPSGQIKQQKAFLDRSGVGNDIVFMEKNGSWIIKVSFPGQDFRTTNLNEVVHYLPSENQTIFVRSQSSWATVGTWASKTSMHHARSDLGAAVVNEKIYAIGGKTENGYIPNSEGNDYKAKGWISNVNEEYDPSTNKWSVKAPMPTSRYNLAVAAFQNKVYCIGGITNWSSGQINVTKVNEVYNPATDEWSTKAPMPFTAFGQAHVLGNKIYVLGGGPNRTINQVYDPSNDSWTTKASMPTVPVDQVSVAIGNKIYVFGYLQDLDNNVRSSTLIYDPKTDSWSNGKSISSSLFGNRGITWRGDWWSTAAGATTGEMAPMRIYVFFMQYVYAGPIPNIVYNPITNSLDVAANEPTNRQNFAVATLNDTLYLIGGYTTYYPAPDDSLFNIIELATTEQYIPAGYGNPDPSYLPPTAIIPTEMSLLSPLNQTYNESSVPLIYSVDKPVAWASCSLDGLENVTANSNITLKGLPNGTHNITLYARDTFGNSVSPQTVTFTVAEYTTASFSILPVIAVSTVLVIVSGACLSVYFKKRRC